MPKMQRPKPPRTVIQPIQMPKDICIGTDCGKPRNKPNNQIMQKTPPRMKPGEVPPPINKKPLPKTNTL